MQLQTLHPEPRSAGGPGDPPLGGNPLGAYLRARRDLVSAADAGLPALGVRRVPGLRREEVAMLAGISADYYLRLERGKDRHPSRQVLASIARVLRLDEDHRAHLFGFVADDDRPGDDVAPDAAQPVVSRGTLTLLGALTQPAFIEDEHFDIVATNEPALALSGTLAVGRNQVRDLFLDAETQALHPGWSTLTGCFVGALRRAVGPGGGDARFAELVAELRTSQRFRELWDRHDVQGQSSGLVRMHVPGVGPADLHRERLTIDGTDLALVVLTPAPGTREAAALDALTRDRRARAGR